MTMLDVIINLRSVNTNINKQFHILISNIYDVDKHSKEIIADAIPDQTQAFDNIIKEVEEARDQYVKLMKIKSR